MAVPAVVDETWMSGESWTAEHAFATLARSVHGYLRTQLPAEADDLLGEVFVHVTRGIGRFRGDEAALRRWVFTIAHHRVVDERRRRVRRPRTVEPPVDVAGPSESHTDPGLVAALNALTVEQREVVVLRFLADLPLDAVAGITRRRVGAVKALQHRALENLAAALTPAR
jgi:RNA polymerase sigma-70 factor (ECF subfamily)